MAINGIAIDIDDDRAHGKDERLGVDSYYRGVEFYYRYVKTAWRRQIMIEKWMAAS